MNLEVITNISVNDHGVKVLKLKQLTIRRCSLRDIHDLNFVIKTFYCILTKRKDSSILFVLHLLI